MLALALTVAALVRAKDQPVPRGREVFVVLPGFGLRGADYSSLSLKSGFSPADTLLLDPFSAEPSAAEAAKLLALVREHGDLTAALEESVIRAIDQEVDWKRDSVILFGHSVGCALAAAVAAKRPVRDVVAFSFHPELFQGLKVRRLVVLGEQDVAGKHPRLAVERRASFVRAALAERTKARALLGGGHATFAVAPGVSHYSAVPAAACKRSHRWQRAIGGEALRDVWADGAGALGKEIKSYLQGRARAGPALDAATEAWLDAWSFLADAQADAAWMAENICDQLGIRGGASVRVHASEGAFLGARVGGARGSPIVHAYQPDGPLGPWWLKVARAEPEGRDLAARVWAWVEAHTDTKAAVSPGRDRELKSVDQWRTTRGPSFGRPRCAVHREAPATARDADVVYLKVPSRAQATVHALKETAKPRS